MSADTPRGLDAIIGKRQEVQGTVPEIRLALRCLTIDPGSVWEVVIPSDQYPDAIEEVAEAVVSTFDAAGASVLVHNGTMQVQPLASDSAETVYRRLLALQATIADTLEAMTSGPQG